MKVFYQMLAMLIVIAYFYQEYQGSLDQRANEQYSVVKPSEINQSNTNWGIKNNSIKDYRNARIVFWSKLYPHGGKTLYCREHFSNNHGQGINVEHVFPMSWVTKGLSCGTRNQCRKNSNVFNSIEADLHNLYPARTDVNEDRSSFRFGEVKGENRNYGKSCDFEINSRARMAEPTSDVRGDIARAMFYMAYQYKQHGLVIFSSQGKILYQWHLSDPPNNDERNRNNKIESLQGNRNIFIDKPQKLADLVQSSYFYKG